MLNLVFSSYFFIISSLICFCLNWNFFFNNNFFHIRSKNYSIDKFRKINVFKKLDYRVMYNFFLVQFFFFYLSVFLFRENTSFFWWGHFHLTNFDLYLYYYVLLFNILCLTLMYLVSRTPSNISTEYVFALINIMTVYYLLFFSNTFYTAFFILELISCFIFYKFSISKFWFKNNKKNLINTKNSTFLKLIPKTFVNTLFFQYWSTFFSSVILLFSLIYFFTTLSSSEWSVLNHLNFTVIETNYFDKSFLYLCVSLLILGVFIKLGATPLHLYKIEIYKGIPLISLFFYTTFFFLIYFLFFTKLFLIYLYSYSYIYFITILLMIGVGLFFIISLLFNTFYLKVFFAYSSVINSMIVLFAIINSI